jgi:cellulose synthase/poly-beta-1,6-N-acetylglucosamine synthase-like glycosyltransferase
MTALFATVAGWLFLICLAYLLIVTGVLAVLALGAIRENVWRAREARLEDFDTLATSPFTIPVSVVAPAFNEAVCIVASVRSLLALDYPEHEIIVVNDGSTDGTLRVLKDAFDLEPLAAPVRRVLAAADIRQLYRSRLDRRLFVIDKVNGGKADALNAGIDLARYRYVCCVDADTVFYPDALLRGMRLAMHDPARVVGVTSQVALSARPEIEAGASGRQVRIERRPLLAYQTFDYLRAFVCARLAWSRWNFMLCSVGAFSLWRRDVLLDLGGFSRDFTCEDIEFTFRVHEHYRRLRQPYRILSLAEPVGVTEGPETVRSLISQRARWQRVIAETVWHYRRMLGNPRYGTVGMVGMPYYVLAEVTAPVFQLLALVAIPLAVLGGVLDWSTFTRGVIVIAIGSAILTNTAILVQDRALQSFAVQDLPYMIVLAPLELFLYRPLMFWAQMRGTFDFLRGERGWHKFARNQR